MSFLTKIQDRLVPIKSVFKIDDMVRQVDDKQLMMVKGYVRAPHAKLPLVECEWYDAKQMKLCRNLFPQEALVPAD